MNSLHSFKTVLAERLQQAQHHHRLGYITKPQLQEIQRFALVLAKDILELEETPRLTKKK